jgi:DNA repair exonuclease SbcCD nuclease subunit
MKIAFISDTHIGVRNEENLKSLSWMAATCEMQDVKVVLHNGDLFDKTAKEHDFWVATNWIKQLHAKLFILYGNHGTAKALEVLESAKTATGFTVNVIYTPEIFDLDGLKIFAMPHLDKAHLQQHKEYTGTMDSQEDFNNAVKTIFDNFSAESHHSDKANIFIGHLMVNGSETSTGQELYDPGLSQGFGIPLHYLTGMNLQFATIGHIHKHQVLTERPCPIMIPGSHTRHNHGETELKGFVIAEFNAGKLVGWEFIVNPFAPQLITEEWAWDEEKQDWDFLSDENEIALAHVRIIAGYPEGAKPNFQELVNLYDGHCRDWRLEKIVKTIAKARCAQIVEAVSPFEKLEIFWDQGNAPEALAKQRIIKKLDAILASLSDEGVVV